MTKAYTDDMVKLVLVRHAKSDWGVPGIPDHERPLNARGERDAPMMAQRLVASGIAIDRILSSTAVRARTTAAEFAEALGVERELDSELYASSARTLADKAESSGVQSVMLVAHNPGISDLAERLSHGNISHLPTCAVATFTWEAAEWQDVDWDDATDWHLETPR